ncbi:XTP/dITP diphosphohydrolase [Saccharothrix saharensis]|uniref:XTP/dITP diphosphohydrolase n=1 Tax=Saccharothrix saharensis TaxID=571190 RepID=A0A543JEI8_9PSEU|nr:MazG family protein [Saccharothrix saharensis]TQM81221.1 XTP/dITP diphosphohydrolase [Saccharothrix saharensis]
MTVVVVGAVPVLPAAALSALRGAAAVYAGEGVDAAEWSAVPVSEFVAGQPVVLITTNPDEPVARELVAAGAEVVRTPGVPLLEAAAVMDRLRSPGGCPWDAEQDHKSLRQYLVEETYELLEAIEDGDRAALREELGDVLLQVLFHARIAAEDAEEPFGIDEVAGDLVAKLVGRHPHVFEGGDPAVRDATSQQHRWEELKQAEKRRESSVDGVAMGQPAVALAGKLAQRVARAGLPVDLLPEGDDVGVTLFAVAAVAKLAGEDPETELRVVARRFEADVRAAEKAARAAGVERLTAEEWRRYWPR